MSDALKGKQTTGKKLTPAKIQGNKDRFETAVAGCLLLKEVPIKAPAKAPAKK